MRSVRAETGDVGVTFPVTNSDKLAPAPMPPALQEATLRPPLKWAGGKRWQVPHLLPIWKSHAARRLVEPLCGGLAVTLGLSPDRALLNDAKPHLINFYLWLQKGLRVDLEMAPYTLQKSERGPARWSTNVGITSCNSPPSRCRLSCVARRPGWETAADSRDAR